MRVGTIKTRNAMQELEDSARLIQDVIRIRKGYGSLYIEAVYETLARMVYKLEINQDILTSNNAAKKYGGDMAKVKKAGSAFVFEHVNSVADLKYMFEEEYKKNGNISLEFIKGKILEQKMCWITIEENQQLTDKGFKDTRTRNPKYPNCKSGQEAYKICGITIFENK
jgi:hypothetical protein